MATQRGSWLTRSVPYRPAGLVLFIVCLLSASLVLGHAMPRIAPGLEAFAAAPARLKARLGQDLTPEESRLVVRAIGQASLLSAAFAHERARLMAASGSAHAEAFLEDALVRAPFEGRAWSVLALQRHRRDPGGSGARDALRLSLALAPRDGSFARLRSALGATIYDGLDPAGRAVLEADSRALLRAGDDRHLRRLAQSAQGRAMLYNAALGERALMTRIQEIMAGPRSKE